VPKAAAHARMLAAQPYLVSPLINPFLVYEPVYQQYRSSSKA
jgi:hypothetical protein